MKASFLDQERQQCPYVEITAWRNDNAKMINPMPMLGRKSNFPGRKIKILCVVAIYIDPRMAMNGCLYQIYKRAKPTNRVLVYIIDVRISRERQ